jgi:hypothetical protein
MGTLSNGSSAFVLVAEKGDQLPGQVQIGTLSNGSFAFVLVAERGNQFLGRFRWAIV